MLMDVTKTQAADNQVDEVISSTPAACSNTNNDKRSTPRPQKKDTERRCIVHKESKAPEELIRFVLSPDNIVTPDLDEKLPGRGAWVSVSKADLEKAIKNNLFKASFKSNAIILDGLIETIRNALEKKCLNTLNIARRSGDCILGFDKASSAAKNVPIAVYVTAAKGDSDSRKKLENILPNNAEIVDFWDADVLSANFGTENTNHVVLKRSGIAEKFIKEYRKLYAFSV